ncbi:1323_t:CDS:1, partial [Cetraspora pellucida]
MVNRKKYRCANCRRLKDMIRFPLKNIGELDRQGKLLCHVCRLRSKPLAQTPVVQLKKGTSAIVEM